MSIKISPSVKFCKLILFHQLLHRLIISAIFAEIDALILRKLHSTFVFPPVYIRSFINYGVQQFVNSGAPIKNPLLGDFFYASIQIYANNGNNAQTQCNSLTQRKTVRLKQNRKNKQQKDTHLLNHNDNRRSIINKTECFKNIIDGL